MVSNETFEKSIEYGENLGTSIATDKLQPFREYLDKPKPWTKLESHYSFKDHNFASTDLNIHERLLTENPLIEIEYQIIDTIGNEYDEDSDNSEYERNLYRIISLYDSLAIMVISNLLDTQRIKFLQAIQLLRFIGKIRHLPTYYHRTWLLVKNLSAVSKYVCDGASLGLLYLENPSTINVLRVAIERESSKQLRENMTQVLRGLEKKIYASSITKNTR